LPGEPDDPVGRLEEAAHRVVDLAILEPHLDQLREVPLGGDPPAVARQEPLAALARHLVEPVGDGWAAWCFHSFGQACRRRARRLTAQRLAVGATGSTVQEVKSTAECRRSRRARRSASTSAAGTPVSITFTQSSGS
jgi:hypothetical protein